MRKPLWFLLLLSEIGYSCTVDHTPYEEYIQQAEFVFLGAVVEIRWVNYEESYAASAGSAQLGRPSGIIELPATYQYRAIPSTLYKGTGQPPMLLGGYCHGALVEGAQEYIIVGFKDGGSIAYSVDSPAFSEIVQYLDRTFVARKPE